MAIDTIGFELPPNLEVKINGAPITIRYGTATAHPVAIAVAFGGLKLTQPTAEHRAEEHTQSEPDA